MASAISQHATWTAWSRPTEALDLAVAREGVHMHITIVRREQAFWEGFGVTNRSHVLYERATPRMARASGLLISALVAKPSYRRLPG